MAAYAFYENENGKIYCDYLMTCIGDTNEEVIRKAKRAEAKNETLLFISYLGNGYRPCDFIKWQENQIAVYHELLEEYTEDNKKMQIKIFGRK